MQLKLFLLLLFPLLASAQTTFSSQLPLLVIDTEGAEIMSDDKIMARLGVVDNGPGILNSPTDAFNGYDGWVGIEFRGSTSLFFDKKGYSIETREEDGDDLSVSLFNFPEEEDWVLHGPYSDKSLLRNALLYSLAGEMMAWAPRVQMVEVLINDEYLGVYLFTERIKRDNDRVDIAKLNPDEISGDDLTGGYILKFDKLTAEDDQLINYFASNYPAATSLGQEIRIVYDYPRPENLVEEQRTYIQDWVHNFEDVLFDDEQWLDPVNGYASYLDVNSAVDLFLLNEISRNVDGYRLSTYFHKQKDSDGGQLAFGPVWDFNLAFGNANYCNGSQISDWAVNFSEDCPEDSFQVPVWWARLQEDPAFDEALQERYFDLREGILSNEAFNSRIDSFLNLMGEAPGRNFERWSILGEYVWPNNFVGTTYEEEVDYLRNWTTDRLAWIDNNIEDFTNGTIDQHHDDRVIISPNPSMDGRLQLKLPDSAMASDGMRVMLHDLWGRRVFESLIPFGQPSITLNPQVLPGMYTVSLQARDGTLSESNLWICR